MKVIFGAVGISFQIGTKSFLFINCHLSAHQEQLEHRNAEIKRIGTELKLIGSRKSNSNNITDSYDFTFWFGDMNYRVELSREEMERHLLTGIQKVKMFLIEGLTKRSTFN